MKWRTLQPTTFVQVAGVSHVLGYVQRISQKLEVCASKERRLLQNQVQLGIGDKALTIGWYFGIGQGSW